MTTNTTITEFMMNKFEELRKANRRISLRLVAYRIGITPGRLSELVRGKRPLSEFYFEKIATGLNLSQEERQTLRSFISVNSRRFNSERVMDVKHWALASGWEEYAILNLLRTADSQSNVAWIAQRLNLSESVVKQCLENLEQMELVRTANGQLEIVHRRLITSFECASEDRHEHYKRNLEKAAAMIGKSENASFTGLTVTANPAQVAMAERMIERFRGRILRILQQGPQTEVYALNIQMFPLSVPETHDEQGSGAIRRSNSSIDLVKA